MAAKQNSFKKRLRITAGPNGSGKSTIYEFLKASKIDTGIYLNADIIEKELAKFAKIELINYGIHKSSPDKFNYFLKNHSLNRKAVETGYKINLELSNNIIINPNKITNSYAASIIVDFIRQDLLQHGKKITFETVMSHSSKIDILKKADKMGYKTYLYFVCTDSVGINIKRVKQRVKLGGHPVKQEKIEERYIKSLKNLKEAVKNTYRSFIFDNSDEEPRLILEIFKGEEITFIYDEIPHWVENYLLKKDHSEI